MLPPIQLIVGLGNPGPAYEATRHNVGAWFIDLLAEQNSVILKNQAKFSGKIAQISIDNQYCWLLVPTTFMNNCGVSIRTMAQFYKIPPNAILIAHDDLDFPVGTIKLKQDGGHGGHNGLRDIIQQLHSNQFARLRIGIGHPGHKERVPDYVLSRPSKKDQELIHDAFGLANKVLPLFLAGEHQRAIELLHTN